MDHSCLVAGPRFWSGVSHHTDPIAAVEELAVLISNPNLGLLVVFASSRYDPELLAAALHARFGSLPVVGCSTCGEIGPEGYCTGTLTGLGLHREDFLTDVALLDSLSELNLIKARQLAHNLVERLTLQAIDLTPEHTFGLMLVDGLSGREDIVSRAFYDGLAGIPLIGGSAGDDLQFQRTWILHQGRSYTDAALLLLVTTPFPISVFKTQHFVSQQDPLVVTKADPQRRIVYEINGCPAVEEYARIIGVDSQALDASVFSFHPIMARIANTDFVRSVRCANQDGSLAFYCAIDVGLVLRLGEGVDMVENLRAAFSQVTARIGTPALTLGCDCMLRQLEARKRNLMPAISALLQRNQVIGCSTFGEQFRGMHLNQTFTAVSIGSQRSL